MKEEKLKPCPVCGESWPWLLVALYDKENSEWYVFCDRCKTKVGSEHNETKKDAIKVWNKIKRRREWKRNKF